MTSPFTARRLADMRTALDEPLTPIDRDIVTASIAQVEDRWTSQKTAQYANAFAQRDTQHSAMLDEAASLGQNAASVSDQVTHGRLAPADARAWLRDAMAAHSRLLAQHQGISASEPDLTRLDEMSPDDYQDQQFVRMPRLAESQPRLTDVIQEYWSVHADELNKRLEAASRRAKPRYPVYGPTGIHPSQLRGQ